ncbi:hypothetical protein FNI16_22080 [Salmonella enterica subsp. diarizonae]|uniref:hypothetical protein n=1 Tax=Salmonella enterica TaxID=28901 RepID=UPI000DECF755|nr:hypothetical protein [Salmonella enterica]AXC67061.1 hypothetical protein DOE63_16965 [Salmonella enterica subsp. diarizonae serovar 59:z10:-]EAO5526995.1 hypothetical protein [Salmonella enterica subsp. enterica serovar Hvittingfoss]EBX4721344.1 hypothetical protein [Salmonella enterica subsp. enterica serovar Rubislaw]EBY0803656.1 hypothetical protein [Salmonella enterica subsp. enterica serovar Berlin]ECJ2587950.1 hypothetical protein [Salmonella enterica subsp. diarizonae]EDV9204321.1 
MIYDWYIQQHMQAATGLELDDEDFTWQFRGVASDHVNTYMLFEHEKLLVAMETMLDSLESDEATVTRCRQVLTLWITGLDTLARERNSAEILPRVHPHSSGQADQLLSGDIRPLQQCSEEDYLRLTGQTDLPENQRIPQKTFNATEKYWQRFEAWLGRQLRETTEHCFRQLSRFVENCNFEPRILRRYKGEYGDIRVDVMPQDIGEIDVMEFDPDYIISWVDKVADGVFTPLQFVANVYYRNGVQMASFRGDTEVDNISHMTAKDYGDVVGQAVEWVREQFDEPASASQPVVQLPRLAA